MLVYPRYLVVSALISGRNFPERPNYSVICEARFNNEALCTDPVAHTVEPDFAQELAWELDRTSLRQHRLQRTALKLQVFAVHEQPPSRESLGYFMLDLRSCSFAKDYRWYRLLHSKYRKAPEVFCGIYLDEGTTPNPSAVKVKTGLAATLSLNDLTPHTIAPEYGDQSDAMYCILGPDHLATGEFTMTLHINCISDLSILVPTKNVLPQDSDFYFSYSLFGHNVTSKGNSNLAALDSLSGGGARVFGIRSSVDVLRAYFVHISPLHIHLYYGSQCIAKAFMGLENLLKTEDNNPGRPVISEDNYERQTSTRVNVRKSGSPITMLHREVPQDASLHHYCYVIELRNLRSMQYGDYEQMVYARYLYPLFGSRAPVMTSPPVSFGRYKECTLPEGFCAFEFAASPSELQARLASNPLVIELFDRSEGTRGGDRLVGRATLYLDQIFQRPCTATGATTGVREFRGVTDVKANRAVSETDLSSPRSPRTKSIGQLTYGLVLEDRGLFESPETARNVDNGRISPALLTEDMTKTDNPNIRATPEYKTALDLELWRTNEETKFNAKLREREQQVMRAFAEEWHRRDTEREGIHRKKMAEYQLMEDKLRTTLSELSTRECQLAAGESELARLRRETLYESERQRKEAVQQAQTQVREMESQLKLERKQTAHWKKQAEDWQSRCSELDNEASNFRTRLAKLESKKNPETTVTKVANEPALIDQQLEVAHLRTEVAEVRSTLLSTERQLEDVQRGRVRYQQLWTRALHEVARLRHELDSKTRQTLAQKEVELERLRSRFLSMEEQALNTRLETDAGIPKSEGTPTNLHLLETTTNKNIGHLNRSDPTSTVQSDIARLVEERDGLLSTGVYDTNDPIILNLEQQIRLLSAQ